MRERGGVLLIACYEMGHPPLAVAWPAAFLERAGFSPAVMDLSLDPFDPDTVRAARLVAISVPMHTALRLGVRVAERVRALNPSAHVCVYGLYASLNADHLLAGCADTVLAGELEDALVDLARGLESETATGRPAALASTDARGRTPAPARDPVLTRLAFPVPSRGPWPSSSGTRTWSGTERWSWRGTWREAGGASTGAGTVPFLRCTGGGSSWSPSRRAWPTCGSR